MPTLHHRAIASSGSPEKAARVGYGLSQQQLARWLGVTVGFVGALETGRKLLPPALIPRLLVLLHHQPPPVGSGPLVPPVPPVPPWPAPFGGVGWPAPPVLPPVAAGADVAVAPNPSPLLRRANAAHLAALMAEQRLQKLHTRAVILAHRRRGLARLQAVPAPPEPAEAARWATWLAGVATDLALADPRPAAVAATRHLLAIRAPLLRAEAEALRAAAAGAIPLMP